MCSRRRLAVLVLPSLAGLLLLFYVLKVHSQAAARERAQEQDQLALIALQSGDPAGAEKHWLAAISAWPGDSEAYASIGDFYRSHGRPDLATAAYHRAIQYEPKLPGLYTRLAKAAHDDGLDDESVVYLAAAIKRDPNDFEALTLISRLDMQRGDFRSARAHAEKAVQLSPGSEDAVLQRAETFLPQDPAAAVQSLSGAQTKFPQSWRIAYKLGWCLAQLGSNVVHTTAAIQQLERAESLNENDGAIHKELCRLLLQKNLVAQSLHEGRLAVRLSPNDPQGYFNLYQALVRSQQTAESQKVFARFTALTAAFQRLTELQRRYGALQGDPQIADELINLDLTLDNVHDALVVAKVALSRHPEDRRLTKDLNRVKVVQEAQRKSGLF